jgi:hypothetical protein
MRRLAVFGLGLGVVLCVGAFIAPADYQIPILAIGTGLATLCLVITVALHVGKKH